MSEKKGTESSAQPGIGTRPVPSFPSRKAEKKERRDIGGRKRLFA